jgi:Bacterial membrane protein YfhO
MTSRRLRLAAPALLVLPVLILFGRALAGRATLYDRDIHTLFFGQCESFVRCVTSGSWPLWNPFLGFGQPLLADPGLQVLYPPTWLNLLLPVETYYAAYAAGHVFLAGLGVYALTRRWRFAPTSALGAGLVFMLSGPLVSMVFLWQHLAGAGFIPWVLWAQERAFQRRSNPSALLWGAILAVQLSTGSVDMTLLGSLPAAGLLARRLHRRDGRRGLARAARLGAVAGALAVGLTAALWLPAMHLLVRTPRVEQPEALRYFFSLHPVLALQTLVPLDFMALDLPPETQIDLFGPVSPLLVSLYLGVVALPLVVAGLGRSSRGSRTVFVVVGAIGLALALGKYGVVLPWLEDWLPLLRIFRFPVKAMVLVSLAWGVLVGGGLERRRREGNVGDPARAAAGLAAALLAALVVAVLWGLLPSKETTWEAARLGLAALLAAAGLFLVGGRRGVVESPALVVLLALDLLGAHLRVEPTVPRKLLARPPETVQALAPAPLKRIYTFEYTARAAQAGYRRTLLAKPDLVLPNPLGRDGAIALGSNLALLGTIPARFGIYGSFGFDSVVVPTREQLQLTLLLHTVEETPGFLRLLQVGGVQDVLAFHEEGLEGLRRSASIATPYVRPLGVFQVPDPLPRAYVVPRAREADDRSAPTILLDPQFDPRREVLVSGNPARPDEKGGEGAVRHLALACDRVRADVTLAGTGYLVLLDAYDPAWRALVDGAPAEILRANVGFRAVALEPGDHVVEFVYRPPAVPRGLAISGLTLLAGIVALRSSRRSARAR